MRFLIILLATLLVGCSTMPQYRTVDGAMLGTTYHIVAETTLSNQQIFEEMQRMNSEAIASMSIFNPTSLLSRINRNETDSVDIHIARNIEVASKVNALTPRYDITVKPLVDAYGFAAQFNLPVFVLGYGANTIGHDEGYKGVIIINRMRGITAEKIGEKIVPCKID